VEFLKDNFHEFLGAFAKLPKATISCVYFSVRPSAWNNSASIGRIFMKGIFRKSVEKIQVPLKSEKNDWNFT
jgi:hypothetical protein